MNNTIEKSKRKLLIALSVILIIATLGIGGVVVYNSFFAEDPAPTKGVVGKVTDGWETGIREESAPQSQGIQIPGYGTAVMNAGDTSLVLSIGNPKVNKCGFYAALMLADGTVLYKSELLEPGYGLTEVPLNQTLESGEYTAMVVYKCVTLDKEHTPLNSAESEFKLIVK